MTWNFNGGSSTGNAIALAGTTLNAAAGATGPASYQFEGNNGNNNNTVTNSTSDDTDDGFRRGGYVR